MQDLLRARGCLVDILGMTTQGDQILDRSLSKVGGKGLFVKELEVALEDGSADLAVHSLKDVPMDMPPGFELACVMEREDPRDAWVSSQYAKLQDLPLGAVVGTSSLRRTVLLRALRPDLQIEPLRGNLDTRLRKLDEGHYAGIVLAAAGLKRLGLADRIRHIFDTTEMLPAAGQGALGIEIRTARDDVRSILKPLAHQTTWLAVAAERAVSRAMGGPLCPAGFAESRRTPCRLRPAWRQRQYPSSRPCPRRTPSASRGCQSIGRPAWLQPQTRAAHPCASRSRRRGKNRLVGSGSWQFRGGRCEAATRA